MPTRRDRRAHRRSRAHAGDRAAISTAGRASSPAASASASPSAAPSCATRRPSCSTSRCPTSTPSCASRRAPSSPRCTPGSTTTMIYVTHDQVEAMTLADRIVVLRAGRIEQVGTPLELYNTPANRFVAGFIGAPRMNFLECTAEGGTLLLPGGQKLKADATANGPVTLGIRPQHIRLSDSGAGTVASQVTLVESLGSETIVHTRTEGGQPLLVTLEGQKQVGGRRNGSPRLRQRQATFVQRRRPALELRIGRYRTCSGLRCSAANASTRSRISGLSSWPVCASRCNTSFSAAPAAS